MKPGRGTTDAIFILRQLRKKYQEKVAGNCTQYLSISKRHSIGSHEPLRKRDVAECYVKAVMNMNEVTFEGTESSKFGEHQGYVLSPFLFAVAMDVVTEEVAKNGQAQLFADYIA